MKEFTMKKLASYYGIREIPQDFDEYWNNRIKMLNMCNHEYSIQMLPELETNEFHVYALTFKSFDSATIYSKYIRPKGAEKVPCVLQFHGYPGSSRSYLEQTSFVHAGFAVIAMDCRGQGGYSEDIGGVNGTTVSGHLIAGLDDGLDKMLYVKIYSDVYLLSKIVETIPEIDSNDLYANGASQGAALAVVCAALNNHIKKAAILYPFLSDFKRVFDLDFDISAYEGLRYYSRWFDPQDVNCQKMFTMLDYIDVSHFAHRVKCELLFGISLADQVCPVSSQFAVYNNLNCKKTLLKFPKKGHEPIYEFDNSIIPFFCRQQVRLKTIYDNGAQVIRLSKNENDKLVVQMQPTTPYGTHYLRRYMAMGYDVMTITDLDPLNDYKKIREVIQDEIKKHFYSRVIVIAEDVQVKKALNILNEDSINYAIFQTPVGLKAQDVNKKFKRKKSILFGLALMDDEGNTQKNKQFIKNCKDNVETYLYRKYGRERINDFEDRKLKFLKKLI